MRRRMLLLPLNFGVASVRIHHLAVLTAAAAVAVSCATFLHKHYVGAHVGALILCSFLFHVRHDRVAEKAIGTSLGLTSVPLILRLILLDCCLLIDCHSGREADLRVVPLRKMILELGHLRLLVVHGRVVLLIHVGRILVNVNELIELRPLRSLRKQLLLALIMLLTFA